MPLAHAALSQGLSLRNRRALRRAASGRRLHYKARAYDPGIGRFLQTDPIGTKDDVNLYTYVGNDPLDRTDPTGTDTYTLSGSIDVIVGAGGGLDFGLYFNPGLTRGERFDVGFFGGGRLGVGADVSASINGGRIRGPAESINGTSLNLQAGVGPFSYQHTYIPTVDQKGNWTSIPARADSVGVGISPLPVSGNATVGSSGKFGFQDIKSMFGSMFGNSLNQSNGATVKYDAKTGMATASFEAKLGTRIAPSDMKVCVDKSKCGT